MKIRPVGAELFLADGHDDMVFFLHFSKRALKLSTQETRVDLHDHTSHSVIDLALCEILPAPEYTHK
jgi:hypothetical protein